jgi:hypothetical protein
MNVLTVVEPGVGGVFRHVEGLCRFLFSRGVTVHLAYSSLRGSEALGELIEAVRGRGGQTLDLRVGNAPSLANSSPTVPATTARLSRMKDLEPAEPARRYEYAGPGGLIHVDSKKLGRFDRTGHRITGDRKGQSSGRGAGWEFVHVCIDDASRIAFSQIKPDEKAVSVGTC